MSHYHPAVPFTGKERSADLGEAINRVQALHNEILTTPYPDPRIRERAEAISQALDKGATLRELAKVLDVSPETVRKWSEAR